MKLTLIFAVLLVIIAVTLALRTKPQRSEVDPRKIKRRQNEEQPQNDDDLCSDGGICFGPFEQPPPETPPEESSS